MIAQLNSRLLTSLCTSPGEETGLVLLRLNKLECHFPAGLHMNTQALKSVDLVQQVWTRGSGGIPSEGTMASVI